MKKTFLEIGTVSTTVNGSSSSGGDELRAPASLRRPL